MGAPLRLPSMFPCATEGREWIYLVGLPDGRIKVGKTRRPKHRLSHHRRTIGMAWCRLMGSGSASWAGKAEAEAIRILASAGQQIGRTEVFTGLTSETAIAIVRGCCAHARPAPPVVDEKRPRRKCDAAFREWYVQHFRNRRGDWFAGPPLPDHMKLARTPWLVRQAERQGER